MHKVKLAACAIASLAAVPGIATGSERFWGNDDGGNFGDPLNWMPVGTPDAADTAVFNLDAAYGVTFAADRKTAQVHLHSGHVTFELGGNTYTVEATSDPNVIVGMSDGDSAKLTLVDGTLHSMWQSVVGYGGDAEGIAIVAGPDARWSNASSLMVGRGGSASGTLRIQDGATVESSFGYAGFFSGATGTVEVSGIGSSWTIDSIFEVGKAGSGTLLISDGATVSNGLSSTLGDQAGSTGEAVVTGAESLWTTPSATYVGFSGDGSLRIEAGGTVSNWLGAVGRRTGARGHVTVTGPGSQWQNGNVLVGPDGDGVLEMGPGGLVTATNAYRQGATGTLRYAIAGNDPVDGYGLLEVGEEMDLAGILEIVLIDGYSPSLGDWFGLLAPPDTIDGGFTTIDFSAAPLAEGLEWDAGDLYTQGIIRVVPEPGTLVWLAAGGIVLLGRQRRRLIAD